jgi:uncharacterized protein HemX
MEPDKKSTSGALLGLIVIVIILVVGGIYVWQSKVKQMEQDKLQNSALTQEDTKALDALQQEAGAVNANVGVDVNSVK